MNPPGPSTNIRPATSAGEPVPPPRSRPFYSLDAEYRFTYVSGEALDLWQMSLRDLIKHSLWDVFPTARQTEAYARHQVAMQKRTPQNFRIYSPRFGKWFVIQIEPLSHGGLICFFEPEL